MAHVDIPVTWYLLERDEGASAVHAPRCQPFMMQIGNGPEEEHWACVRECQLRLTLALVAGGVESEEDG